MRNAMGMKTARLDRLHPRAFATGRALFAQDLFDRVFALAAARGDSEASAQIAQTAAKLGAATNLAFGHRIADTDIHLQTDVKVNGNDYHQFANK